MLTYNCATSRETTTNNVRVGGAAEIYAGQGIVVVNRSRIVPDGLDVQKRCSSGSLIDQPDIRCDRLINMRTEHNIMPCQ